MQAPALTAPLAAPPLGADGDSAPTTSSRSASTPASTSPIAQGNTRSGALTLQSPTALGLTNTTSKPTVQTSTPAPPAPGSSPNALAATPTETMTPQADPAPITGPLAPRNIITELVSTVLGWVGLGPSTEVLARRLTRRCCGFCGVGAP